MSFEGPNQSENPESITAEKMSAFRARLEPYINLDGLDEWVQDCARDLVTLDGEDERIETFFQNLQKNEYIANELRQNPGAFMDIFDYLSKRVIKDHQDIEVLVHNSSERRNEITKNQSERKERVMQNPIATDEEYKLGVYKESLESHVREAIFILQSKGYIPIESGFYDLVDGSQYIGIKKTEGIDRDMILEAINRIRTPKETGLLKKCSRK